jgi:hypothetical protein
VQSHQIPAHSVDCKFLHVVHGMIGFKGHPLKLKVGECASRRSVGRMWIVLPVRKVHFAESQRRKVADGHGVPLFQRRTLPSTLHCGGQRVILATISTHSRGDGMVLHLADKTSANTTSPANSMLATSENVARSGCAWKWRPRSALQCIGVRMAASSWPTQSYTQERARPARLFVLKPCKIRDPCLTKNPGPNHARFETSHNPKHQFRQTTPIR